MALGTTWMVAQALWPYAIGKAIDEGMRGDSTATLITWAAVFLGLNAVMAASGIMRHRFAVYNWLSAAYRVIQLTVGQANKLGATLPKRIAAGEVISIGNSDVSHIGGAIDILLRGSGAVVSLVVVSIILLSMSWQLGLVVLIGVPVMMSAVGLLIKPLHSRQAAYREQQGKLMSQASDIVAGLRVLRGVGGESVFAGRYHEQSQDLRSAGVRVGRVDALLEAAQVLLPGLFLALVTWLGARFTLAGEIQLWQFIALYGYAAFLVIPLRTIVEMVDKITRGHVAAKRLVRLLNMEPEITDPAEPHELPVGGFELHDPDSGLTLPVGRFTVLASARPEDAAEIIDRLGRYVDSDVIARPVVRIPVPAGVTADATSLEELRPSGGATLQEVRVPAAVGVPLKHVKRKTVRDLILVADNDARLFVGPLRAELDPRDRATDDQIWAALAAASATEVVEALPEGLDAIVAERGREFSGGQQQRLRLTRALLAGTPTLLMVEPTSAVDAHTEARIAARIGDYRAGLTTLIASTSPLVLDRADHVIYVEDGKVLTEGTHRELLRTEPRYRATVTRAED